MISLLDVIESGRGIPVDDPVAQIWGIPCESASGALPLTFTANGRALRDYKIFGQTVQSGTPSPSEPADVAGCGVWDSTAQSFRLPMVAAPYRLVITGGETWLCERTWAYIAGGIEILDMYQEEYLPEYIVHPDYAYSNTYDVCTPEYTPYVNNYARVSESNRINIMQTEYRNAGDFAAYLSQRYSAGDPLIFWLSKGDNSPVFTSVFIGDEPLHKLGDYADCADFAAGKIIRRVKKLVLDGTENWSAGVDQFFWLSVPDGMTGYGCCTHYQYVAATASDHVFDISADKKLRVKDLSFETAEEFKQFLADQNTAGTPVTVWYVLEEPVVTSPPTAFPSLATLSGEATILDYEKKPAPSCVTIKYRK